MKIREFEDAILQIEGIVLRVRAGTGEEIENYSFQRKAANNISITEWLEQRVKPLLNGFQVDVISGEHVSPHGRTNLGTLRDSYIR